MGPSPIHCAHLSAILFLPYYFSMSVAPLVIFSRRGAWCSICAGDLNTAAIPDQSAMLQWTTRMNCLHKLQVVSRPRCIFYFHLLTSLQHLKDLNNIYSTLGCLHFSSSPGVSRDRFWMLFRLPEVIFAHGGMLGKEVITGHGSWPKIGAMVEPWLSLSLCEFPISTKASGKVTTLFSLELCERNKNHLH